MELPSYFDDFLKSIRPTKSQRDDCKQGHRVLRDRLRNDEDLSPIIVSTFLQGSYRRATAVKPEGEQRADVDVIVVTRMDREKVKPVDALKRFKPFLDKHYPGKYRMQGRSIGIELGYVDLDLVPTSAPSEVSERIFKSASVISEDTPEDVADWRLVESWLPLDRRGEIDTDRMLKEAARQTEWKADCLWIPNREVNQWERTNPLEQIRWTWQKSGSTKGRYVNIVKALKWWRRIRFTTPKYPKGYPVEHLIGDNCPDDITSVAAGVTGTLETIVVKYYSHALLRQTPFIPDRGVPEHNVFKRVDGEDFAVFYEQIASAAKIARRALDSQDESESANAWRELFGDEFPKPPEKKCDEGKSAGGFTPRTAPSIIGGGRFA